MSIEEYLGAHTAAYYEALQATQGGSYQPQRDATPFVRFCVEAHLEQAHRRLRQLAEVGERWAHLERLVARRGWPDRLVIALEQSLFHGTDRATYTAEADVSAGHGIRRSQALGGCRVAHPARARTRHALRRE